MSNPVWHRNTTVPAAGAVNYMEGRQMTRDEKLRKPKAGCFFLGCRRFTSEGFGTEGGTYVQRVERMANHIIDRLSEDMDLVFTGVVYSQEDLQRSFAAFTEHEVDCVICSFLTFAEDELWIRFLRMNDRFPLLYLSITPDGMPFENCYDYNDFVQFLCSSSLVGTCNGSGSMARLGRTAETVIGPIEECLKQTVSYLKVCRVSSLMKKAQFGLMPAYNLLMRNTYVSPYELLALGPDSDFFSFAELKDISDTIEDLEVERWAEELLAGYTRDHEIDRVKFEASVRYSLGLEKLMQHHNLDALALHDAHLELFSTIGLRPGFYPPGLNDSMSVLVSEGDIGAAYMALVMKLLTGGQTSFIEPFFLQPEKGTFFGGHGGPNDYTYPETQQYVVISKDKRNENAPWKYAGAPFAWLRIPPGEMTLAQFSEVNGTYRIICFQAESLEGPHSINGYAHSEFRPSGTEWRQLFKSLISIGITQHFIGVRGDVRRKLEQYAALNGIEFHRV